MSLTAKWCLMCGESLILDDAMGFLHAANRSAFHVDNGHTVTPVDREVLDFVGRARQGVS